MQLRGTTQYVLLLQVIVRQLAAPDQRQANVVWSVRGPCREKSHLQHEMEFEIEGVISEMEGFRSCVTTAVT